MQPEASETVPLILRVAIGLGALAALLLAIRLVHLALSQYRLATKERRPVRALRHALWRDPGAVETLDLYGGPGGRDGMPCAPFRFLEEHAAGTSPCMSVLDAKGRRWRIKWGEEVQAETFCVRFVWAAGYFSESTYFFPSGTIEGCRDLRTTSDCVDMNGLFANARFEIEEVAARKHFDEHSWAWNDNPFVGTRELNGLKILVMLLSNWDAKDVRDVSRGSNTAIFEYPVPDGSIEARYLIMDWGGSMGWWGNILTRSKWDHEAYASQTGEFVRGVANGLVIWGYAGQRTEDVSEGISVDDVAWLLRYVGRITDDQIRDALRASGASDHEEAVFVEAIRHRIDQLRRVVELGDGYTPLA